jgi:hypothetical protein
LAFGVFAAPSAQAAETTAYTCVAAPTTESAEFKDTHCIEEGMTSKTSYRHVPVGEATQLTIRPLGNETLSAEVFGAELELVGTGLECVGCMVENTGGAGNMKAVGSGGKLRYTSVTVANDAKNCTVVSDPGGEAHVIETRPLKFETDTTNSVTISPVTPPILATFEIVTAEGSTEECPFVGTHPVEGDVTATAEGATLTPVPNFEGTLTLDEFFPAQLEGEATMETGPTSAYHPAALT